jgi:flagellar basal-body rod protein FlgB
MFDLTQGNVMIQSMDRSLTLASQRETLIASNIANIDTPGYRTRDFSFEEALKAEFSGQNTPNTLRTTNPMHIQGNPTSSLPPSTDPLTPSSERNDGNDVSLDRESMLLTRTQTNYQMASNFMQVELRKLYGMIKEASAH